MDERTVERFLRALHDGRDPARAGAQCGVTLLDATRWGASAEGHDALGALQHLARARVALVTARAKVDAAHALLDIARDEASRETARKACVDLLKLEDAPCDARTTERDGLTRDEERAWLAALERVGSQNGHAANADSSAS